jgi:F0F1-type ATP synthase membrane subunit c/vacuolar-type H+-ATPase subunit K
MDNILVGLILGFACTSVGIVIGFIAAVWVVAQRPELMDMDEETNERTIEVVG